MKPPKFHVGQAVVCVEVLKNSDTIAKAIERGQVYIVRDVMFLKHHAYEQCAEGWYIGLEGFPSTQYSSENQFAPAEYLSDEALAELLEEVFTPVHA